MLPWVTEVLLARQMDMVAGRNRDMTDTRNCAREASGTQGICMQAFLIKHFHTLVTVFSVANACMDQL